MPGNILVLQWHIGCFRGHEIYQDGLMAPRRRPHLFGRNTVLPAQHATDPRGSMPRWRPEIQISLRREDMIYMGANSKQGWYLFLFILGFTFLPAGLAYLGPLFTLAGLVCLIGSLIGLYRIKPLEHATSPELSVVPPASSPKPDRAVGSR